MTNGAWDVKTVKPKRYGYQEAKNALKNAFLIELRFNLPDFWHQRCARLWQ
jgi:hypothetical protein